VARKDGIFDDATLEISELTAVLKLDRDRAEKLIEVLKQKAEVYGSGQQAVRHAQSIVKTLEMKLGDCTQGFTRALELRARTMQLQQKKRQAFTGAPSYSSSSSSSSSSGVGTKLSNSRSTGDVSLDMGGVGKENEQGGDGNFMQQVRLNRYQNVITINCLTLFSLGVT
jgi:hypothetical protein